MTQSMANREAKDFALKCIERLPFVVGDDDLDRAQRHMLLAFGPGASPQLRQCTPESIGYAIALSAMSGLMPGGPMPDVWLIPRKNRHNGNRVEANWQISARGYVRLARRAGWDLDPVLVFRGEAFQLTRGTSPGIVHVPDVDTARGYDDIRLGYAVATSPNGLRKFAVLRKGQIDQRRAKAETQNIWNEWPEEMALKTVSAYAGRRELFPCDPGARHAIEADVTESINVEPLPPAPEPPRLVPADFGIPEAPEPDGDPTRLDRAEAKALESDLRKVGALDSFAETHGPPSSWTSETAKAALAAIAEASK